MVLAHKRQQRQHNPPFTYVDIDPESVGQDLPDPYAFLPKVDDFGLAPRNTVELLRPGRGDSAPSPKTPGTPRGGGGVSSELREYKSLCELLLPGLRTHSHLAQLIQRCPWSVSVVLREHGVVIGGTTFRVIRSQSPPVLFLDVLLLAVDPRPGVCGHGWGTRLVNYLKAVVLHIASREKAAAMMLCQADVAGGVANQFWARQRLRATPQAAEVLRALHMWDAANDLYAHSIPMACWLQPGASVKAAESARAQESATVQYLLPFKSTRHTPSARQHVGARRLGGAAVGWLCAGRLGRAAPGLRRPAHSEGAPRPLARRWERAVLPRPPRRAACHAAHAGCLGPRWYALSLWCDGRQARRGEASTGQWRARSPWLHALGPLARVPVV